MSIFSREFAVFFDSDGKVASAVVPINMSDTGMELFSYMGDNPPAVFVLFWDWKDGRSGGQIQLQASTEDQAKREAAFIVPQGGKISKVMGYRNRYGLDFQFRLAYENQKP